MLDISDINVSILLQSHIATGQVILVDFYASWCGPCKMLAPQLEKLTGVTVLKINGDHENPAVQLVVNEIMTAYEVTAFPTILIFKKGTLFTKIVGANLAAIKAAL